MTKSATAEAKASPPTLAQAIGRLAAIIAGPEFPPGDRAALRRLDPEGSVPLAFYRFAFRHLPGGWEAKASAWTTLIAGIAIMSPHSYRPDLSVGRALAEAGYAESRLERLLMAEGETLRILVLRAARFLAAKKVGFNWVDIAYLLGLGGSRERARLDIAKTFYRHTTTKD